MKERRCRQCALLLHSFIIHLRLHRVEDTGSEKRREDYATEYRVELGSAVKRQGFGHERERFRHHPH